MPGAQWFRGARFNFAENLLRYRDERTALSYGELYREVAKVAVALRRAGVKVGDRVVGFMPNMPESIIAMLGATAIGATCPPVLRISVSRGCSTALARRGRRCCLSLMAIFFKGKPFDSLERIGGISQLPSLEAIVVVPYISDRPDLAHLASAHCIGRILQRIPGGNRLRSTLSSYRLITQGTSCTPQGPPVYLNAWCTVGGRGVDQSV
ncbi:MAG: AMP-binding protein [Desulfobulbus sp.]